MSCLTATPGEGWTRSSVPSLNLVRPHLADLRRSRSAETFVSSSSHSIWSVNAVLSVVSHLIWPAMAILSAVSHRSWPARAILFWRPAVVRQHISPEGRCAHSPQASDAYCPFRTNGTNYPRQCSVRAPLGEGGVSQLTNGRPRASLDWIPGSATPQRWKHDDVHGPCRCPQPRADPSGSGHAQKVGGQ